MGPFKRAELSRWPTGCRSSGWATAAACCTDLDRLRRDVDASGQMEAVDRFGQKAWDMLSSPAAQKAFDLDAEPQADCASATASCRPSIPARPTAAARRTGASGCCSPARLVEAGVRLVTVDLRWWDTHVQGFDSLRRGFLPRWDQAYPALIEDLERARACWSRRWSSPGASSAARRE